VRTIEKRAEPNCLAGLRREAKRIEHETGKPPKGEDWDIKECGDPLRQALCRDQHGLCAYCMRRIRPSGDGMKIEHFVTRSGAPRQMYDWDNLLGVCSGVLYGPTGATHICDTARGHAKLHVHPAKPPPKPEAVFIITKRGSIDPRSDDAEADCTTLNLNHERLVAGRQAVISDLRKKLRAADDAKSIRRMLETASTPTHDGLPEFARVMIEYLQRKLRARER